MTQMELELKFIEKYGLEQTLLIKYVVFHYLNTKEPVYLPITKMENQLSVCSLLKIGNSKATFLVKSIAHKIKKGKNVLHNKPLNYYVTMARETFFVPQKTISELWENAHVDNLASPFSREPYLEFELLKLYGGKTFYTLKLLTELFIANNFVAFSISPETISELLGISTKTFSRILKKIGQRIKHKEAFDNASKPVAYKITRDKNYRIYVHINIIYNIVYCTKNRQNESYLKTIIPKMSLTDTPADKNEILKRPKMKLCNSEILKMSVVDTPVDKNGILKCPKMKLCNSENVPHRYSEGQKQKHIYNNINNNKDYLNKHKDNTFIYDKNTEVEIKNSKNKKISTKVDLRRSKNKLVHSYLEENSSFNNSFNSNLGENTILLDISKDKGGLRMSSRGISKKMYSAQDVDTGHVKSSDEILKQVKDKKFEIDFSLFDKKELTPKRFNDILNAIYSSVGCPEHVFYSIDYVAQRSIKKMIRTLKQEGMTNSEIMKNIYLIITKWDEIKKHPKLGSGSRIRIKGSVPSFWDIYNHHKDLFIILEEITNKKDDYEELGLKPMTLEEYKQAKKIRNIK